MKTYNLAKEILVVSVPEDAKDFLIDEDGLHLYENPPNSDMTLGSIELHKGNWSILSTAKEMTERKAMFIMEKQITNYEPISIHFKDYNNDTWIGSALESFHSFMKAIGMPCVNPYGKEPIKEDYVLESQYDVGAFNNIYKNWQEAEAKLVNTVILVKE